MMAIAAALKRLAEARWPLEGAAGRLAMANAPLDLRALLAEAG
jgi:hypothetical protein